MAEFRHLAKEGLDIEEFHISARDGHQICVESYQQSGLTSLPLLIYMHAEEILVLVLNEEYRLSPEKLFPTGFEDSFDVVRWAIRSTIELEKGFLLYGTSAGANFTAGIAHLAVQKGLSLRLTGLLCLAGSFCHPDVRPTKYRDRNLSVDELFESHANLAPRVAFYVSGWDPRRDEALLFEQLLREEELGTKLIVYPGLPYGFWTTCPDLEVSRCWQRVLIEANYAWLKCSVQDGFIQILCK
ncbi:Alpha/Beta hydrolase protein [Aspergillus leporis]|uniref:Alpha/Beta hydrolase protein n=1 Tax=Aspergillus leporis TaxID=41062 RepID=A0A5N5WTY0_9EURO|nr:Alpha/Beta hydrolase protein [Aspergillus leporis]